MTQKPAHPSNSCRPLQMVHSFENWAGSSEYSIRARVRQAAEAGIGGVVVNVRYENYMRDESAWETLRIGVRIAHEEGMRVWIYDEEGYPSGAAGGMVLEQHPSGEAQGLVRVRDAAGNIRYDVIPLYEATHATENFYKKRHYINILDPQAVATFINVTHERYAKILDPLARYVEAFFTDEPSLISVYIPKDRDYPQTLPWHPRLPEEFRTRKGYDLLPHRESLFAETADKAKDRQVRCDFYRVIADLCAETYFGALQEWCHRHNIASAGHLLGEETMVWQTDFNGDPFTCYRKFDVPGIDMLSSDPEQVMAREYFLVPKVAGSAARLQGKKRVMCEISDFFGILEKKKHATIEQMKATAAILFSCGITDLCSYYAVSLEPGKDAKEFEFPASEYIRYTDFTSRLALRFTQGVIESRVAVLHPIVSLWAHFTPSPRSMYEDHPTPEVRQLDKAFCDLCRSLLQSQVEYDIVDERSLASARIEGTHLTIGARRYDVLVLPPLDTIRVGTMEKIAQFSEAGGAVFGHALSPEFAAEGSLEDPRIEELVGRTRAAGGLGGSLPGSPPVSYLIRSRIPPECELIPASSDILCTSIQREGGKAHFLVNTSSRAYEGICAVRNREVHSIYDPSTGATHPIPAVEKSEPRLRFPLSLREYESVFLL